jgi:hexulose-6-phosphate isomerase
MMQKGINRLSFPMAMNIEECMRLAKTVGFSGFEPVMSMKGELSLESTDDDILRVAAAAEKIGITLTSLCQAQHRHYTLTNNSASIRQKAKLAILRQIDIARLLGVNTILTVPGAVFLPPLTVNEPEALKRDFFAGSEVIDYDTAYERSLAAYRELAVYAEEKGVVVGVENIWNGFLLSPLEMRAFIDEIGSPWVKVYFDVGNITAAHGFAEHWIKILGDRICMVHIKDYRRWVGTRNGYVDLYSGDVDFGKVMAALRRIGYGGWLNAELFPQYKDFGESAVYSLSASMDRILREEQI